MKISVLFCLLFFSIAGLCQENTWGLKISNYITGKPVVTYHQLFYTSFHPGIEGEVNWQINKSNRHKIYASANLGVYYHRFMHTGLKVYPELNYNYSINQQWMTFFSVGGGYIHSFENVAVLRLNEIGDYDKVNSLVGRPQFMFGYDFGVGYRSEILKGGTLNLSFSTFLQGPFVSGYVPLLPYNMVSLGFIKPIVKNK
jgi:hypothetical protein